jgi:hypothetical protein
LIQKNRCLGIPKIQALQRDPAHHVISVEQPWRLDQALRRRGSRDFASIEDYRRFVEEEVAKQNRRRNALVDEERRVLKPLPPRRTTDFTLISADVTRNGTVSLDRVTYSVPSRLVGRRLHAHLHDDRIELFLGPDKVMTTTRVRVKHPDRGHSVDFRHVIGNLRRKPQALRYLVYREALFPTHAYLRAWQALDAALDARQACRDMVALLDIAANGNCIDALGQRIEAALDASKLPDIAKLKGEFLPTARTRADVTIPPPDTKGYNCLLASTQVQ